jgi:hypothetical protein
MRRLVLALLICLLPLQSFAGLVMNAQMAGMGSVLSMDAKHAMPAMDSVTTAQAPCHEASQPLASNSQDCCDSQAMCYAMCQLATFLPVQSFNFSLLTSRYAPNGLSFTFASASAHAPQKPPIS